MYLIINKTYFKNSQRNSQYNYLIKVNQEPLICTVRCNSQNSKTGNFWKYYLI